MKYSLYAELEGTIGQEFSFLAKAISKDYTRFMMNYIYVEQIEDDKQEAGLRAIATDGHRMHIVEPLAKSASEVYGITAGWYKVICTRKKLVSIARVSDDSSKECGQFPNWKRVLPVGEPKAILEYTGPALKGNRKTSIDFIKFFRDFPEPIYFSLDFLFDLGIDYVWSCEYRDSRQPVQFVNCNKKALIMTMIGD